MNDQGLGPEIMRWSTLRGVARELGRINRRVLRGRPRLVKIPLPADRFVGQPPVSMPVDGHHRPAVTVSDTRPPYWPTLGDCIRDLTDLDTMLRAKNKRAVVHVWLPMPERQGQLWWRAVKGWRPVVHPENQEA